MEYILYDMFVSYNNKLFVTINDMNSNKDKHDEIVIFKSYTFIFLILLIISVQQMK